MTGDVDAAETFGGLPGTAPVAGGENTIGVVAGTKKFSCGIEKGGTAAAIKLQIFGVTGAGKPEFIRLAAGIADDLDHAIFIGGDMAFFQSCVKNPQSMLLQSSRSKFKLKNPLFHNIFLFYNGCVAGLRSFMLSGKRNCCRYNQHPCCQKLDRRGGELSSPRQF